jgi:23S rRNA (pseudouridine1915-N3)-methyltransferase
MRLLVAAVGRLKQGPERDLAERYAKRAADAGRKLGFAPVDVAEVRESRARDAGTRTAEESIALGNAVPKGAVVVVLDSRGESLTSEELADRLRRWHAGRRSAAVFLIGGADGLTDSLRDRADLQLAFGKATWPHQLVRIMLLEQIYRAVTILSGHPYHRA